MRAADSFILLIWLPSPKRFSALTHIITWPYRSITNISQLRISLKRSSGKRAGYCGGWPAFRRNRHLQGTIHPEDGCIRLIRKAGNPRKASAAVQLRPSLFWDVTSPRLAVGCRTYPSHTWSSSARKVLYFWKWERWISPKRRQSPTYEA